MTVITLKNLKNLFGETLETKYDRVMALRTVFMGSPIFAVPCLRTLAENTDLLAVVCQTDKPSGRGLEVSFPAVKTTAQEMGLPILQPRSLRKEKSDFAEHLYRLAPDLVVVVAYGKILPPEVLQIPHLGCWNVHASILPKYRGAAPIQWALMQGETSTGVTLMQMDVGLDTGPLLLTRSVAIQADDTSGSLQQTLASQGAAILREGLFQLLQGTLPSPEPQDNAQASMAPLLTKEHGKVDFTRPADYVSGQIRGVTPWPGAYTFLPGRFQEPLKLFHPIHAEGTGKPGEILEISPKGLLIACGEGALWIQELQLPGRKRLSVESFVLGHRLIRGEILGDGMPNVLLSP